MRKGLINSGKLGPWASMQAGSTVRPSDAVFNRVTNSFGPGANVAPQEVQNELPNWLGSWISKSYTRVAYQEIN
jgi:hypothetical protein